MKFYIFGNTKKDNEIICTVKKAAFITDDFETSLCKFRDYINEVRYTNCYLVVDFEVSKKPTLLSVTTLENDYQEILPFLIIGEWHIGEDKSMIIRGDHTIVRKPRFIHEFENNATMIRDIIYCLNNHIEFKLEIIYQKDVIVLGNKETKEFKRTIANSVDIIRSKGYPIRKIKIQSPDWIVIPIVRNFKLFEISSPTYQSKSQVLQVL